MKYLFGIGRWKEKEVWLENGRVYYVSLEYFAIKFMYDRRGFGNKVGQYNRSLYWSIEVLF